MGLNYEDPTDRGSVSTISFGYIDYNQVKEGAQGLNWYTNVGQEIWALELQDFQYNNLKLANQNTPFSFAAVIDSGNMTI